MARYPRLMPTDPRLHRARVVGSRRLSPSFQRVTIAGADVDEFAFAGFDHWFRLFLPPQSGAPLTLPGVVGRGWYRPFLAIPEAERPHCSNYTVADFRETDRGCEMDIDVVLHWDAAGEIAGGVAIWATSTGEGDEIALLDQGLLFDPPADAPEVVIAVDETGLPAARGILRHLDAATRGRAIIEVPHADDVEPLAAPAGVAVEWVPRDAHAAPGERALVALKDAAAPASDGYGFVVGESTLATEGRRHLHRAGLPKSRITFSGFWRRSPEHAAA